MNVFILFMTLQYTGYQKGGLAQFQQEFKTLDECRKAGKILTDYYNSDYYTKSFCLEIRK